MYEQKYIKLYPTLVNYSIDSVLQKQYEFFFPHSMANPNQFLKFNKKLCSESYRQAFGADRCDYCTLKKVNRTYFIIYYFQKDKKQFAIPIKEIHKDYLLIYGIEKKEGFFKLGEIKEIMPGKKLFIGDNL